MFTTATTTTSTTPSSPTSTTTTTNSAITSPSTTSPTSATPATSIIIIVPANTTTDPHEGSGRGWRRWKLKMQDWMLNTTLFCNNSVTSVSRQLAMT